MRQPEPQHVSEVIEPALAAGKVVICDRFVDSKIASIRLRQEIGRSSGGH